MTWVDKQLQEEGVQISEASRSPAVNGKSDTLDAEGEPNICMHAELAAMFLQLYTIIAVLLSARPSSLHSKVSMLSPGFDGQLQD